MIMNKTEQAKLDMVHKMLKGQIDVEEVAMISGVDIETVRSIREDMNAQERKMLGGLTVREVGYESALIDNEILQEEGMEDK